MIQDPPNSIHARRPCPLSTAPASHQRLVLTLLRAGTTAAQLIDPLKMQESPGQTPEFNAILVADDDEQLATALQWILADEKFLVDVALNGEEALLKVKVHDYNVIICHMKMPCM